MSELLTELVRRYSPSTLEAPAVTYLTDWMRERGFEAWIDEAGNACGIRGASNAPNTLILLGHIDTFPGEILVRVEDGKLYGRGSVDAKGPLCAFAEATAQAAIPEGWRVFVVGGVEEETTTSKGAHYISDHYTPTFCIIGEPSGSNRITLGYKGRILVEYRLRRAVAHTARPEPTVGALGADFWNAIHDWAERENHGVERVFDQIMPSLRTINTSSDYFNESLNMTVAFRLPPRLSPEDVLKALRAMAQPDGELRPAGSEIAYQADKNTALTRGMMSAIRSNGNQPGFVLKTGTCDMNIVAGKWKCPMIAYGPGDSNLDHTPNEHVPLSEYQAGVKTLKTFIESLSTTV
jgi:LysW-gamma-L-lysine carboxypeptidase